MDTNQDGSEVQKTAEEVAGETTNETPAEDTTLSPEEIADLKKRADASSQNYERAKKAEAELKEAKAKISETSSLQETGLSNQDVLALAKGDIHEDDMDEVIDFAKFKKISVKEALKSPMLKNILATKTEERKTAAATLTKAGSRGTSKVSGEDLLNKAERTGEVPDSDEGLHALFLARQARKLAKKH